MAVLAFRRHAPLSVAKDIIGVEFMNQTLQLGGTQVDGPALAEVCRRYGVKELSVFGSAVRGEMRPESDCQLPKRKRDSARNSGYALKIMRSFRDSSTFTPMRQ